LFGLLLLKINLWQSLHETEEVGYVMVGFLLLTLNSPTIRKEELAAEFDQGSLGFCVGVGEWRH
jgi:hypothetical protein